jgi:hypothetical protein
LVGDIAAEDRKIGNLFLQFTSLGTCLFIVAYFYLTMIFKKALFLTEMVGSKVFGELSSNLRWLSVSFFHRVSKGAVFIHRSYYLYSDLSSCKSICF